MTDAELHRYMSEPRDIDEMAAVIGREWRVRKVDDIRPWAFNLAEAIADKAEARGHTKMEAIELGAQAAEAAIVAYNASAVLQ